MIITIINKLKIQHKTFTVRKRAIIGVKMLLGAHSKCFLCEGNIL